MDDDSSLSRGRLRGSEDVPSSGEDHRELLRGDGFSLVEILTGHVETPMGFVGTQDEWVVVLEGRARLDIAGREVVLESGDWVVIPTGRPHEILEVEPATRWLALHGRFDLDGARDPDVESG